ncbi:MAG: chorismate synthase [Candidatus Geothermarchaeales archaeon]
MGERFVVASFGESHGRCIGALVDGCPAGLPLLEEDVQRELNLRKPGQSEVTTTRAEEDRVEILSGVFEGWTTGAPICLVIWNRDVNSTHYEKFRSTPRPGHADYTARVKYGGFNDWRGGGRFSGRTTATYVLAGAIAKKLLAITLGIEILAYTSEIGEVSCESPTVAEIRRGRYSNIVRCPDQQAAERMRELVLQLREEGDSVGGVITCIALKMPVGLGEPVLSRLDADLSRGLYSIPAVRGVEFGAGFSSAQMRGSMSNDPFTLIGEGIGTKTNQAGGVLGGLSSGMPLELRVVFKPPSSISLPQRSVDLESGEEVELQVKGRHDPVIVPRAVPVVESVVGLVLADHALRAGLIPPVLDTKERD